MLNPPGGMKWAIYLPSADVGSLACTETTSSLNYFSKNSLINNFCHYIEITALIEGAFLVHGMETTSSLSYYSKTH